MTINWRQVLEIETYLNKIFERHATIERFLWRNSENTNSGFMVDKDKDYFFEDVYEYLLSKYPEDEMIKNGGDFIRQQFNACLEGKRLCEIEPELLELNKFQEKYRLSDHTLKRNILNRCSAFTGATAFYIRLLKNILDSEKEIGNIKELDESSRKHLKSIFSKADFFKYELKSSFESLEEKILLFMNGSKFGSFKNSCERNNYKPPYSIDDIDNFKHDVLAFSKSEVIDIINSDSEDLFAYKLRKNESPYPEELRKTDFGDINVFTTIHGLFHYNQITELRTSNNLLIYIHNILNKQFEILQRESINDDYNPEYTSVGNQLNSSLIIGTNLNCRKLYNENIDDFHNKVISGYIWFHDDVRGTSFDYLRFHSELDLVGDFKYSMPFINVISSYHIAYLQKGEIERDYDDLKNNGYFETKEDYLQNRNQDIGLKYNDDSNDDTDENLLDLPY